MRLTVYILVSIMKTKSIIYSSLFAIVLGLFTLASPTVATAQSPTPPFGNPIVYPLIPAYAEDYQILAGQYGWFMDWGVLSKSPANYFEEGYCYGAYYGINEAFGAYYYPILEPYLLPWGALPYPVTPTYQAAYYAAAQGYLALAQLYAQYPSTGMAPRFYFIAGQYWAVGDVLGYVYDPSGSSPHQQ